MVYELAKTSQFKASLKRAKKRDVLVLALVDTGTHSDIFKK